MKISFDSKFFRISEQIVDMMFLSFFWVVCSLPLITVIPATIALYYAAAKVLRRETGKIAPEYFRGLKDNFKQGFVLNIIYLLIAYILYVCYEFAKMKGIGTPLGAFYYVFLLVMCFLLACITYYLLPFLSRFRVSLFDGFRMSIYLGSKNLGTMIPLIITFAGAIALVYVFPFTIMFVPGFYAYQMTKPIEQTFRDYIREELPNPEEHYGMWYMDEPAIGSTDEEE